MKGVVVAALLLAVTPLFAEEVITHCETSVVTFNASMPWNVRRLGTCSDAQPENALWHLDRIDSPDGRLDGHFSRMRAQALVYVVDTGVDSTHDEFAEGNVIDGIDVQSLTFTAGSCAGVADLPTHPCTPADSALVSVVSHGTGVASVIGGRNVGVSPGASIVAVRMLSSDATKWLALFDAIIRHAWKSSTPSVRTAIVNFSTGLEPPDNKTAATQAVLAQKIRDMVYGVDADGKRDPNGKRFFFTVAAGNAAEPASPGANRGQCGPNYEVVDFPGYLGPRIDGVVTVGGIEAGNRIWSGSCRGGVEVLAPAEHVLVASSTGRFDYRSTQDSGTSWSTPITAGVAAWLLTMHPDMSPAEIEETLESSGSSIDGIGVVNIPTHVARRRGVAH